MVVIGKNNKDYELNGIKNSHRFSAHNRQNKSLIYFVK